MIQNNLDEIFKKSNEIGEFSRRYFDYLNKLMNSLDVNAIAAFANELEKARSDHNTIFFIGNGGSAVTASHMANDFGTDIRKKGGSDLPFRAMALTDNMSVITAIANDDGYENIFVNQLRIHFRPGDKLVAISVSGNSPNVVEAAKWVKHRDGTVLSLVGFDGGKLKQISDVVVHVETLRGEYGPVEDIHMVMDHLLANWLQYKVQERIKMGEER
jgi:D-sedoheptulose 7-phosphate isomerase